MNSYSSLREEGLLTVHLSVSSKKKFNVITALYQESYYNFP